MIRILVGAVHVIRIVLQVELQGVAVPEVVVLLVVDERWLEGDVSGQIGSLPIPQSTLQSAMQRLMDSPENREKLKLPSDISDLRIENGEVVASYK